MVVTSAWQAMRPTLLLLSLVAALAAPAATATSSAPAHGCVRAAELGFRTADGVGLLGHRFGGLRPGAKPVAVLAHMSNGSLCEWLPEARRLAAHGIFVLAFDFRGHGESQGAQRYGRLGLDVAAAVWAVRGLGARHVVVVGASLGGIAAVVGAATARPPVDGVASVSGPAVFAGRLDARPFAPRLQVPALFLASREDENAGYDFAADAQRLYDATGSEAKRLELFPGSLHGVFLVEGSARARSLLEAFIRDPRATART
jgi:pimeloyl-ACP methyl ester carboxylesterase